MQQLFQDLSSGSTHIIKAPMPQLKSGNLLINTAVTLVSPGTERMLVDFSKASYLEKARQQPEKVKQALDKIKTDGLITTISAIKAKLGQPLPLGYCNVGIVSAVGAGIVGLKPGDRVVSNGPHADIVNIPKNLCALIPDNVDDESAAFTVIASIGLQGIRLINPTLGECVAVIGVGIIGLLTVQLLRAHGCKVLAIDFDQSKLELAKQFGAEVCNPRIGEDAVAYGMAFSKGYGIDAVVITAATKSNDPVMQAARMCRKRGRIVLVGVTGLDLNRDDFYKKELSFQVSCSYGPGRYDIDYEEKGQDYPFGFVRWTAQRNFVAILDMMSCGLLDVKPLITHRFKFEDAPHAYQLLTESKAVLGLILRYTSNIAARNLQKIMINQQLKFSLAKPILGLIGGGNYAARILIPAFAAAKAQLHTIVTEGGINAVINGKKFGFKQAATDIKSILELHTINTIVIATRHNSHAELVVQALLAGKHIFVEKPIAITMEQLNNIESTYKAVCEKMGKKIHLMVGFNRRFSPLIQKIKALLDTVNDPKSFIMTINAGYIPADHWTQDKLIGGGRIVGEACHFIDLMRCLANSKITSMQTKFMNRNGAVNLAADNVVITLGFADGSVGSIHYLSNGAANFSKERIEIFTAGRILQLDNFIKLTAFGWPAFKKIRLWKQNKGQQECVIRFLSAIEHGDSPIPIEEIFEVSRIAIQAAESLT